MLNEQSSAVWVKIKFNVRGVFIKHSRKTKEVAPAAGRVRYKKIKLCYCMLPLLIVVSVWFAVLVRCTYGVCGECLSTCDASLQSPSALPVSVRTARKLHQEYTPAAGRVTVHSRKTQFNRQK